MNTKEITNYCYIQAGRKLETSGYLSFRGAKRRRNPVLKRNTYGI